MDGVSPQRPQSHDRPRHADRNGMTQDQLTAAGARQATLGTVGEATTTVGDAKRGDGIWRRLREQVPLLLIAAEFLLIVLLVRQFRLESQTFSRLMLLAFVGFLIHHFLPLRARRPFFALLSVAATVAVVDTVSQLTLFGPGVMLVALGMGLIGVCHLPVPMWARVGLLSVVGAVLAVIRAETQWFPALETMWPVLASMFIFRVMVYLYDLKHHNAQFGIAHAVAYFFMLPNACFPLFPIVDYKTFCTTYYNDDAPRIYQTGVEWMFRGIVHLLLYRVVYQYGLLNISDVADAADVAKFMVATYLLYLRVSGQFHLIVGLLHMFGFNLPETHHSVLAGFELHRLLASDQYLLEGLHHEDLLLSGVLCTAQDRDRAGDRGRDAGRFFRDVGASLVAMVLVPRPISAHLARRLLLVHLGHARVGQRGLGGCLRPPPHALEALVQFPGAVFAAVSRRSERL